jgi:hypothetical protein
VPHSALNPLPIPIFEHEDEDEDEQEHDFDGAHDGLARHEAIP